MLKELVKSVCGPGSGSDKILLPARSSSIFQCVMPVLESKQSVPMSAAEDGTIRIGNTRVSLESVVLHYEQGATAEEIVLRFPALRLADVHSCLAYYLNHHDELHEYMTRQQKNAQELQGRFAADPAQQRGRARMRERIQNRAATKRQKGS